MIKVLIVDDEHLAQSVLEKTLLNFFPNKFHIVGLCNSVDEAVVAIDKFDPELVFLDIQMPGKDGFELFKYVEKINFQVVFVTAYNQFAIKAIKYSALDYLLKPISYVDLAETIKRFDTQNKKQFANKKLTLLLENLNVENDNQLKIAFPTMDGFEFMNCNQLLYCKADSNYTIVRTISETAITVSKTLKFVEDILPSEKFMRIHKSYIINLNYIVKYFKSTKEVELTNGERLPVSFRKEEDFLNAILPA